MEKLSLPRLRRRENERQSGAFQKLTNVGGGALADNDDVYVCWCASVCVCVYWDLGAHEKKHSLGRRFLFNVVEAAYARAGIIIRLKNTFSGRHGRPTLT